eukprot:3347082-Rhodomonas_salina.3
MSLDGIVIHDDHDLKAVEKKVAGAQEPFHFVRLRATSLQLHVVIPAPLFIALHLEKSRDAHKPRDANTEHAQKKGRSAMRTASA